MFNCNFFIFIVTLVLTVGKTWGQFRCYACGFSASDTDRTCLTISEDTHIVECSMPYCTIFRQEYLDPAGAIASFYRGCESSPDFLNHEVVDSSFKTYYRACTNDLCNSGDGIQSATGGSLSPTPEYDGTNLLVPGRGAAGAVTISVGLVMFMNMLANIV